MSLGSPFAVYKRIGLYVLYSHFVLASLRVAYLYLSTSLASARERNLVVIKFQSLVPTYFRAPSSTPLCCNVDGWSTREFEVCKLGKGKQVRSRRNRVRTQDVQRTERESESRVRLSERTAKRWRRRASAWVKSTEEHTRTSGREVGGDCLTIRKREEESGTGTICLTRERGDLPHAKRRAWVRHVVRKCAIPGPSPSWTALHAHFYCPHLGHYIHTLIDAHIYAYVDGTCIPHVSHISIGL